LPTNNIRRAPNGAKAEFEKTRKEKIKIPCATRWVEKQDAVHTFFAVYPVVCDQLESLADASVPQQVTQWRCWILLHEVSLLSA
jgi:hypothetical protein